MSTTATSGTELAPRAGARTSTAIMRRDRLRLEEYDLLRQSGKSQAEAWRAVATSETLGFARMRPDASDGHVLRHLSRFLARLSPERIERGRTDLAETIPDAVNAIGDIIRGEFGTGKVVMRGSGEDRHEEVEIDAAAAGVRSQNARWLLERVGVAPPANAGGSVAVQVNVGNPHATAAAMLADPEIRAAAIDLARRAGE